MDRRCHLEYCSPARGAPATLAEEGLPSFASFPPTSSSHGPWIVMLRRSFVSYLRASLRRAGHQLDRAGGGFPLHLLDNPAPLLVLQAAKSPGLSRDARMPSTPSEEAEAQLQLVQGPHRPRHTIASTLHIVLSTTAVLLRIPFHLLYHYVIRHRSPFVQDLGRSPFVEAGHILVRHLFLHCYLPPSRPVFRLGFPSKWVKDVDFAGVRASWIAPPDRPDRTEDEIVLFWLNGMLLVPQAQRQWLTMLTAGGGFVHDVGGMSRLAYVKLAKMVNKRDVKFSIFHLHYRE